MIEHVKGAARELGALYGGSLPRGFFTIGYSGGVWMRVVERHDWPGPAYRCWTRCYGASFWLQRTR